MKKLGVLFRETLESQVKGHLEQADGIFIITYAKLSSPDLTALRQSLRNSKATLFVAKNSVVRRALKDLNLGPLSDFIHGPCGLVFSKGEPVEVSQALCNFSKDHEQLKLEAGFINDRILKSEDIQTLAKLPPKQVLRAQVVMGLKSPLTGLVMVLKGNLRRLVWCLEQIKNKREK